MTKQLINLLTLAALVSSTACSSGATASLSSQSPTAPSSTSLSTGTSTMAWPSAAPAGTSISGPSSERHEGEGVELEGLVQSLNLAARSFVVRNTTVTVPAGAIVRHGGQLLSFADLRNGDRVHVRGSRSSSGVVASQVVLQNDHRDDTVKVEGTVSNLAGSCPSVTFVVASTKVTTAAGTRFSDGACAELANGLIARVRGSRQTDGTVAADVVSFEDVDDDGVRLTGAVAGLSGACPALTFTLGTTTILTDADTRFQDEDEGCGKVKNGLQVTVTGRIQADGSLKATSVRAADDGDDDDSRE